MEASALRRRDIVFDGGQVVVHVARAYKRTERGIRIGPQTTPKSLRSVSLPLDFGERLKGNCRAGRDDPVFARPSGNAMQNSHFHEQVWRPSIASKHGQR